MCKQCCKVVHAQVLIVAIYLFFMNINIILFERLWKNIIAGLLSTTKEEKVLRCHRKKNPLRNMIYLWSRKIVNRYNTWTRSIIPCLNIWEKWNEWKKKQTSRRHWINKFLCLLLTLVLVDVMKKNCIHLYCHYFYLW